MKINLESAAVWVTLIFIVISPIENILRIESILYVVGVVLLLTILVAQRRIEVKKATLPLIMLLVYTFISCFWSPNPSAFANMIPLSAAFIFLILQLQFDYSNTQYEMIKRAFIIQGFVLIVLCFSFGMYMDGRFWLRSTTSGADPNYLSGWFIIPECFAVEELTKRTTKFVTKGVLLLQIALSMYFIFQTGSRSGLISIAIGILLAFLYSIKSTIREHPVKALGIALGFIALVIIAVNNMPEIMVARLMKSDSNLGGRGHLWIELITKIFNSGIGVLIGMGQGATIYYNSGRVVAHNTYLDVFFNTGLVGLSLILTFVVSNLKNTIKERPYTAIANIAMIVLTLTLSSLSTRFFMLSYFILGLNCSNDETAIID